MITYWSMRLKNNILLGLILIITLGSCRNKSQTENTESLDNTDEIVMKDFTNFYDQFQQDSAYQMNHIVFPLPSKAEQDGWLVDVKIEKEDWKIHKPLDDMGGTYQTTLQNLNGIVIEQTVDYTGQFSMIRRFAKLGDEWNLIYYKPMGK